jgi:hypothetical protein
VRSPGHLVIITIPASAGVYLILAHAWVTLMGCIFLAVTATVLALLLLPVVWSRKQCRRDAAYDLVKLIIESHRTS